MPVLADLKDASGPTISASQITSYLLCSLKYKFHYIDKIPRPWKSIALAFGSAIHSALEAWQLSRLAGDEISEEEVRRTFMADWEAELSGDVRVKDDDEPAVLVERGQALIKLAMDTLRHDPPQAVELPFLVDLFVPDNGGVLPVKLRGVFDLLLAGDRLVEMKTAAKRYDQTTVDRNLQLSAYHYAYTELTGRSPEIHVVTLLKTKTPKVETFKTTRSPSHTAWFLHLVREIHAGISNNLFFPNPSWPCSDCEYAENCREWRG